MNIAIDGPAGAGKSTIAKLVAEKIGAVYVDTGALFRAVGFYLLNHGISPEKEEDVEKAIKEISVSVEYFDRVQNVFVNGENVTDKIRTTEVGAASSKASTYKCVRRLLLSIERKIASEYSVVMDGRDIGTVVLPDADVKVFLTASDYVRAIRRQAEMQERGISMSMEEIMKAMKERDERDANRAEAPLKEAPDAIRIDSSDYSIAEVVNIVLTAIHEKERSAQQP